MPGLASSGQPGSGGGEGSGILSGQGANSFEITVACGPKGVVIYPGDRKIDLDQMKTNDSAVPNELISLVRARRAAEPELGLRPRVRFLMKPGGEATYLKARWQTTRADLGFPATLQVVDRSSLRLGMGEVR